MPKRTKLTNSSDETEVSSLISGDTVFSIPYFQRPYKWKPERLKQLNTDILNIIDSDDSHFFGAIIIHGRKSNPADPNIFDIIDGQQRITTLILYIAAIVKLLCEEDELDIASGLFLKYLVIARDTKLNSNIKIHPCKEDRAQMNYVYADLLSDEKFKKRLGGFQLKSLPPTGSERGTLKNNYKSALRFLREQFESEGISRVHEIYQAILESISIVQIDVWDPTNGPKIFDGLNSRQEPMTIGDLVRNEIFSRIAHQDVSAIEVIDETKWQPFYKAFQQNGKNLFDSYFFPFGLIQNQNLKKSEVYNHLRKHWEELSEPSEIIDSLSKYQQAFIDIVCGTNLQKQSKKIYMAFKGLYELGAPSSTLPFLMQLSSGIKNNSITEKTGLDALNVIESFLVRRAICGHEPTGLHAVFKKLWSDCNGSPTRDKIIDAIKKHKTVAWPSGEEVENAIKTRPMYGSSITSYVILQYDISLQGDMPGVKPWIEHVLPQNPDQAWFTSFTKDNHEKLKDTLANLIPLTEEMNRHLSNKPYIDKHDKYKSDSSFKSTREFANQYNDWTPITMEKRANQLAAWAISRWKY
ncbi:DUF262 domain-containing protein [Aeromonas veronii]